MPRRPSRAPATPEAPKHRINRMIRISPVLVVDEEGTQLGMMSCDEARYAAESRGLDLVEVAPNARPPVCRIMDYGRFKYEQSKKAAKQASSTRDVKTVQFRPKTDDHDLDTKLRRAAGFLDKGNPVRLVMRLRGRERAYPERWIAQMREHIEALKEHGKAASRPNHEGRTISMLVEPLAGG